MKGILCIFAVIAVTFSAPAKKNMVKWCKGKPADVFFLLDSSSSIWIVDYRKQLNFVADVLEEFQIADDKTRIAAAIFSDKYSTQFHFSDYNDTESLKQAVKSMTYLTGGTETHNALKQVREEFQNHSRKGVAHIAIVLTDGNSNTFEKTVKEADKLRKEGVYVFAIGVGKKISMKELEAIGSSPQEEFVFRVASFDMLETIRETLAYSACKVQVTTTPPPMDQPRCQAKSDVDVMFALDAPSMGIERTRSVHSFISDVTEEIYTDDGKVRIGMMSRSCNDNDITLNQYDDEQQLVTSIRNAEYKGLDHQVHKMRHSSYTVENGGRSGARKVAVIFVDESIEKYDALLLEAEKAKLEDGIEIYVVAIGDKVNFAACGLMASQPVGDHIIKVSSHRDLGLLKDDFLFTFCRDL